ncbi:hypothetical protein HK098_005280 [Nowakowskiella sp. JEL0407]|nr:hypothetical protein HK098_005280 [Nowakowskiella sp. JEL0407]
MSSYPRSTPSQRFEEPDWESVPSNRLSLSRSSGMKQNSSQSINNRPSSYYSSSGISAQSGQYRGQEEYTEYRGLERGRSRNDRKERGRRGTSLYGTEEFGYDAYGQDYRDEEYSRYYEEKYDRRSSKVPRSTSEYFERRASSSMSAYPMEYGRPSSSYYDESPERPQSSFTYESPNSVMSGRRESRASHYKSSQSFDARSTVSRGSNEGTLKAEKRRSRSKSRVREQEEASDSGKPPMRFRDSQQNFPSAAILRRKLSLESLGSSSSQIPRGILRKGFLKIHKKFGGYSKKFILLCNVTSLDDVQNIYSNFYENQPTIDQIDFTDSNLTNLLGRITLAGLYRTPVVIVLNGIHKLDTSALFFPLSDIEKLRSACSFTLQMRNRIRSDLKFQAESSTEYQGWIEAFHSAIAAINGRPRTMNSNEIIRKEREELNKLLSPPPEIENFQTEGLFDNRGLNFLDPHTKHASYNSTGSSHTLNEFPKSPDSKSVKSVGRVSSKNQQNPNRLSRQISSDTRSWMEPLTGTFLTSSIDDPIPSTIPSTEQNSVPIEMTTDVKNLVNENTTLTRNVSTSSSNIEEPPSRVVIPGPGSRAISLDRGRDRSTSRTRDRSTSRTRGGNNNTNNGNNEDNRSRSRSESNNRARSDSHNRSRSRSQSANRLAMTGPPPVSSPVLSSRPQSAKFLLKTLWDDQVSNSSGGGTAENGTSSSDQPNSVRSNVQVNRASTLVNEDADEYDRRSGTLDTVQYVEKVKKSGREYSDRPGDRRNSRIKDDTY